MSTETVTHTWTPEQIADGIVDTLAEANNLVKLAAIRAEWATVGITRDQLDQVLAGLHMSRRIVLHPESNQKMLTEADWDAALWFGGEYRHLAVLPTIR